MPQLGRARPHLPIIPRQLWQSFTRLYLPSTGAAAVSPAFDAGWEDTTDASPIRRAMVTTPIASAMTTLSNLSAVIAGDILFYQGVSFPLSGAQTIVAQTIRVSIRALETLSAEDSFVTWVVYVVSNDGGTVRGTLVAIGRDDVECDTALTNRLLSATGGSVAAQDGDRIVVELGIGSANAVTAHVDSIRVGDAGASDLPYDDVTTTDLNPYLQFSQVLVFGAEATGVKNYFTLLGVGA